jgi:hypothetical protein
MRLVPDRHFLDLSVFHHDRALNILLAAAALFACLGAAIILRTLVSHRRHLRVSWRDLIGGFAKLSWMAAVGAMLLLAGFLFLVRSAGMPSETRRPRTITLKSLSPTKGQARRAGTQQPPQSLADRDTAQTPPTINEPGPPDLPVPPADPAARSSNLTATKDSILSSTQTDAPLPDWIGKTVVESKARKLVVVASDFAATTEAAEQDALRSAVGLVAFDFAATVPDAGAANWKPPAGTVRSQAVRRVHVQRIDRQTVSSGTPFHVFRAYYQVELSPAVRNQLFPLWKQEIVDKRFSKLGALAGLLTLTFGAAAAYFRLDDWTSGQYRRRLKLAAVMIVTAGGFAAATLL